jgi:hypothetical protein
VSSFISSALIAKETNFAPFGGALAINQPKGVKPKGVSKPKGVRDISFFTFPTRYFHFPLLLESKIRLPWQRVRYSLFLADWTTSLPGIPGKPEGFRLGGDAGDVEQ